MMRRYGILLALALIALNVPAADAADIVGRGSIGGSGGIMNFVSGDDFGEGKIRLIGQAVFKYNFSDHWAGVVESGWGWNAYPNDTPAQGTEETSDTLATVIPTTLGLEYRMRYGETKVWPHFGAGAGLYTLGVKDTYRSWAYSPVTHKKLIWTSPGLYVKLGGEYLFDNGAAINVDVLYHSIFSKNTDDYPYGWGAQNTSFAEFRVGANYYFTLHGTGPGDGEED